MDIRAIQDWLEEERLNLSVAYLSIAVCGIRKQSEWKEQTNTRLRFTTSFTPNAEPVAKETSVERGNRVRDMGHVNRKGNKREIKKIGKR